MDYNGYLLSGDIPIAEIQGGKVIPLDRSLPLYLAAGGSLEDWLAGRAIDRCRPNSRILKKVLRLTDSEDVAATPELVNIGSYEKCWRIESGNCCTKAEAFWNG